MSYTSSPPPPDYCDKQLAVIKAAYDVFARYGLARTTMQDIAKAAGLSRPALYLVFANKEDIFSAVVQIAFHQKLQNISDKTAQLDNASERLLTACLMWTVPSFKILKNLPDAADMFDLDRSEVQQGYDNFQAYLAELFCELSAEHSSLPTLTKPQAADLAQALLYGLRGIKQTSSSEEELNKLTRLLVSLCCHGYPNYYASTLSSQS